jgi:hypothetical protein
MSGSLGAVIISVSLPLGVKVGEAKYRKIIRMSKFVSLGLDVKVGEAKYR